MAKLTSLATRGRLYRLIVDQSFEITSVDQSVVFVKISTRNRDGERQKRLATSEATQTSSVLPRQILYRVSGYDENGSAKPFVRPKQNIAKG